MSALFDPAAIERRIDESLAGAGRGGAEAAFKRASLLTLVVVHPRSLQAVVADRLDYLFGRRPLRIIRIETGHSSSTTVDVQARCSPHPSGDEVCFQEIVYYSGPDGRGLDGAFWSPLIIRDLPVVLMWLAAPEELAAFLDRNDVAFEKCLVELGAAGGRGDPWPRIFATIGALARRFEPRAGGREAPVLSDLTWRALDPLRARIARLFDPAPARALLARLERVALRGLPAPAAALLALWLASRLGRFRPGLKGGELEFAGPGGRTVGVRLPREGETFAIEFTAGEQSIFLDNGGGAADAGADCGADCLLAEIDYLSPDPAFYDALAAAADFTGGAGPA